VEQWNLVEHWDLIVVGGGPVGMSAADHAATTGPHVLVIERAAPGHDQSSSSGNERQWRYQYAEEELCELTPIARDVWHDLETRSGRTLIHPAGSLWFGDFDEKTNEGQISATVDVMDRVGLPYVWLTAADIEARFPFSDLPTGYAGFLQPDGGSIDVRAAIASLRTLVNAAGVEVRSDTVLSVSPSARGVELEGEEATYAADAVVLAAGPFTNDLLGGLGCALPMRLFELPTAYFRARSAAADLYPTWFVFQKPTEYDSNLFYGFPPNGFGRAGYARVAPDFEQEPIGHPRERGRPRDAWMRRTSDWVARHMPALDPNPIDVTTCIAALPSDHSRQFFLGTLEGRIADGSRVVVSAGGWAFKFAPLFGRACATLAAGGTLPFALEGVAI
jgi:sarcosine oxidase